MKERENQVTNSAAKKVAAREGCELWWDRQWRAWALHRKGTLSVEGSGGRWFSSGTLRNIAEDQLVLWCSQCGEDR